MSNEHSSPLPPPSADAVRAPFNPPSPSQTTTSQAEGNILSELHGAIGAGFNNATERLRSDDPVEKARALRNLRALTRVAGITLGEEPAPEKVFGENQYAPEELSLGIARLSVNLQGPFGQIVRENLSTSTPDSVSPDEENPMHQLNDTETLVAGMMALTGSSVAEEFSGNNNPKHKTIRPNELWSPAIMDEMTQRMLENGQLQGTPEEATQLVTSVREKFMDSLGSAVAGNNAANR